MTNEVKAAAVDVSVYSEEIREILKNHDNKDKHLEKCFDSLRKAKLNLDIDKKGNVGRLLAIDNPGYLHGTRRNLSWILGVLSLNNDFVNQKIDREGFLTQAIFEDVLNLKNPERAKIIHQKLLAPDLELTQTTLDELLDSKQPEDKSTSDLHGSRAPAAAAAAAAAPPAPVSSVTDSRPSVSPPFDLKKLVDASCITSIDIDNSMDQEPCSFLENLVVFYGHEQDKHPVAISILRDLITRGLISNKAFNDISVRKREFGSFLSTLVKHLSFEELHSLLDLIEKTNPNLIEERSFQELETWKTHDSYRDSLENSEKFTSVAYRISQKIFAEEKRYGTTEKIATGWEYIPWPKTICKLVRRALCNGLDPNNSDNLRVFLGVPDEQQAHLWALLCHSENALEVKSVIAAEASRETKMAVSPAAPASRSPMPLVHAPHFVTLPRISPSFAMPLVSRPLLLPTPSLTLTVTASASLPPIVNPPAPSPAPANSTNIFDKEWEDTEIKPAVVIADDSEFHNRRLAFVNNSTFFVPREESYPYSEIEGSGKETKADSSTRENMLMKDPVVAAVRRMDRVEVTAAEVIRRVRLQGPRCRL